MAEKDAAVTLACDIRTLVEKARTYRRFDQSVEVPEDIMRGWVDCARLCPSAQNRQPLRYAVVADDRRCAGVFEALKWAGALPEWPGPTEGERPRGYIVICSEGANALTMLDVGISSQAIKLAAQAQGFGSCMFKAFNKGGVARAIGLDEGRYEVELVMAFGVPVEQVAIEVLAADAESFDYWRDDEGVHHVPKRPLEDVLL